jgi:hypothetical protein
MLASTTRSGQNVLSFDRCKTCGGCDNWQFRAGGFLVASGQDATRQFNAVIEAEEPEVTADG